MATFLTNLVNSIFTPGPSAALITATNMSFVALQSVLFVLLLATYSAHFLILSLLSAFLWFAINWFVRELEATAQNGAEFGKSTKVQTDHRKDKRGAESGEGTEANVKRDENQSKKGVNMDSFVGTEDAQGILRNRRSMGEQSLGDLSTDSEWDKVGESESDLSGKPSRG